MAGGAAGRMVDPVLLMNMADRLRAELRRRGWSQLRLSTEAGISERTVAYLLEGYREPMLSTGYDVARALGRSVEWLWTGSGE